jgi:hypothetical protein
MREDLLARSYEYLNYFLVESTFVESTATAAESVALAAVSTVAAAESVLASVEAPPHAANAAIAKIANTFFIFVFFVVWYKNTLAKVVF